MSRLSKLREEVIIFMEQKVKSKTRNKKGKRAKELLKKLQAPDFFCVFFANMIKI